jgi:hypothetical protein
VSVKSATVRRYPGGPTFTRRAHSRTIDKQPNLAGGATPGQRFWIESLVGLPPLQRKQTRQFTFIGPVFALKEFFKAEGLPGSTLRTPGGRAIPLEGPERPDGSVP